MNKGRLTMNLAKVLPLTTSDNNVGGGQSTATNSNNSRKRKDISSSPTSTSFSTNIIFQNRNVNNKPRRQPVSFNSYNKLNSMVLAIDGKTSGSSTSNKKVSLPLKRNKSKELLMNKTNSLPAFALFGLRRSSFNKRNRGVLQGSNDSVKNIINNAATTANASNSTMNATFPVFPVVANSETTKKKRPFNRSSSLPLDHQTPKKSNANNNEAAAAASVLLSSALAGEKVGVVVPADGAAVHSSSLQQQQPCEQQQQKEPIALQKQQTSSRPSTPSPPKTVIPKEVVAITKKPQQEQHQVEEEEEEEPLLPTSLAVAAAAAAAVGRNFDSDSTPATSPTSSPARSKTTTRTTTKTTTTRRTSSVVELQEDEEEESLISQYTSKCDEEIYELQLLYGKNHPQLAEPITRLGLIHQHLLQDYNQALTHYNEALLLLTNSTSKEPYKSTKDIYRDIGICLVDMGQIHEAIINNNNNNNNNNDENNNQPEPEQHDQHYINNYNMALEKYWEAIRIFSCISLNHTHTSFYAATSGINRLCRCSAKRQPQLTTSPVVSKKKNKTTTDNEESSLLVSCVCFNNNNVVSQQEEQEDASKENKNEVKVVSQQQQQQSKCYHGCVKKHKHDYSKYTNIVCIPSSLQQLKE